jgi:hypothetical protein
MGSMREGREKIKAAAGEAMRLSVGSPETQPGSRGERIPGDPIGVYMDRSS